MNIAILGSTSWIAYDLMAMLDEHTVVPFGRTKGVAFENFRDGNFDVVINCIGSAWVPDIVETTLAFDSMVLQYLKAHPKCKYIFMSSGVAYGGDFDHPVDWHSPSVVQINQQPNAYASSKLIAELRHRALPELPIVDLRVFSYFSETVNLNRPMLMSKLIDCLLNGKTMTVSNQCLIRDYVGPDDMYQLVKKIIDANPVNMAVDIYSREPTSSVEIIEWAVKEYRLRVEYKPVETFSGTAGSKPAYFTENRAAEHFGYLPSMTSLEVIKLESEQLFLSERLQSLTV